MPNLATQAQQELGIWLGQFEWNYWATLTTRKELTMPSARRAIHGFCKFTAKAGRTTIFYAIEPFDLKEGYHLHALLKVPEMLQYRNLVETWQHVTGNKRKLKGKDWNAIRLENYDKKLGASFYLSKYVTKDLSDYDFIGSRFSCKY